MKTVLMALYDPIEGDGRVKRACEALAGKFNVLLHCSAGSGTYADPAYEIRRVTYPEKRSQALRLLQFWWHVIRAARSTRPDVVYGHDFYLPFPAWIASRLTGARFVYDAHELIVPGNGAKMDWRSRLYYLLERLVVRRADLVVAANPERAAVMQDHYGLRKPPTSIGNIPRPLTGFLSSAEALERYPILRKQAPDDIHVVYMGDINLERGLRVLVEACRLLPPPFKLVFVGRGPDLENIRAMAADGALKGRVLVVGGVPHAHVQDLVRQADIGFVTYSMDGLNNVLCAPNKVFEYAHAGLPIVATCQPTIRRLVDEFEIGRLVGCEGRVTAEAVAAAIQAVAGDLKRFQAALPAFLAAHRWDREASRLVDAVSELVK